MFSIVAQVLRARGVDALVFRGADGLDEISLSEPSQIYVISSQRDYPN